MIDGLQFVLAELLLPAAMSLAGRRQSLGLQVTLLTLKLLPLLHRDSHFFSLAARTNEAYCKNYYSIMIFCK